MMILSLAYLGEGGRRERRDEAESE